MHSLIQVLGLKIAGYTYLRAWNIPQLLSLYALLETQVKGIILDDNDFQKCLYTSNLLHLIMNPDEIQSHDFSDIGTDQKKCVKVEEEGEEGGNQRAYKAREQ